MNAAKQRRWWPFDGHHRHRTTIEEAREEVARATRSCEEAAQRQVLAFAMAGRLRAHRAENHFSQRLEELFKESRP